MTTPCLFREEANRPVGHGLRQLPGRVRHVAPNGPGAVECSSAALQQAIDWAYETLSGATITAGRVNPDRSVALTVAGAEITV